MSSISKILCLSSGNQIQAMVEAVVQDAYECQYCDVSSLATVLSGFLPDLVLLDESVSGEAYRDSMTADLRAIPTLYLCDEQTKNLASLLRAYSAGAFDYLGYPFDKYALSNKLKVIETYEQLAKTASKLSLEPFTWEVSTDSTAYSSDTVLSFIEHTYEVNDLLGLAKALLSAALTFRLHAQVMFITAEGESFYSTDGRSLTPLERRILVENRASECCDYQDGVQLNASKISILLQPSVSNDEDLKLGALVPLFQKITKAANAKFKNLDTELALIRQTTNLVSSFEIVQSTIGNIRATLDNNRGEMSSLLHAMVSDFNHRISKLNLSETQQESLLEQMDETLRSAKLIIDKSYSSNLVFDSVIRLLKHLIDKQNELLKENQAK